MANFYYANIDSSATSGTGIESYPFNELNLKKFLNNMNPPCGTTGPNNTVVYAQDYDIVYVKGTGTSVQTFDFLYLSAVGIIFKAWQPEIYGPFKMADWTFMQTYNLNSITEADYIRTIMIDTAVCTNVGLDMNDYLPPIYNKGQYSFENCTFFDSFFHQNRTSASGVLNWSDYFKGCSFWNCAILLDDYYAYTPMGYNDSSVIEMHDCTFYNSRITMSTDNVGVDDLYGPDFLYLTNCVFSGTSADTIINANPLSGNNVIISNCQFGWVPTAVGPTSKNDITYANRNNLKYEDFGLPARNLENRYRYYNADAPFFNVWPNPYYTYWNDFLTDPFFRKYYNYCYGLFSSIRMGPGSLYFTDTDIYVDLSASVNSYAATSANPMTWDVFYDFYAGINIIPLYGIFDYDVVRFRGYRDINAGQIIFNDRYFSIKSWTDKEPWRLNFSTMDNVHLGITNLRDGIIFSQNVLNSIYPDLLIFAGGIHENMFIKASRLSFTDFPFYDFDDLEIHWKDEPFNSTRLDPIDFNWNVLSGNCHCNGCTFISEVGDDVNNVNDIRFDLRWYNTFHFKDCVLYTKGFNSELGTDRGYLDQVYVYVDNCVTNLPTSAALRGSVLPFTQLNTQFGWQKQISWPAWNDTNINYRYSTLAQGITTSGSEDW